MASVAEEVRVKNMLVMSEHGCHISPTYLFTTSGTKIGSGIGPVSRRRGRGRERSGLGRRLTRRFHRSEESLGVRSPIPLARVALRRPRRRKLIEKPMADIRRTIRCRTSQAISAVTQKGDINLPASELPVANRADASVVHRIPFSIQVGRAQDGEPLFQGKSFPHGYSLIERASR